jgi:hypothetical protein
MIPIETVSISRRTFLKAAGALLTLPGSVRALQQAPLVQQEKTKMEIQRVGSKASAPSKAQDIKKGLL